MRWCRIWVRRSTNSACRDVSSASWSHCWRRPRRTSSRVSDDRGRRRRTATVNPDTASFRFAASDTSGGQCIVAALGRAFHSSKGDVEPAVLGKEALVQAGVSFLVRERMRKVTHCRRCHEEHGQRGHAQPHAGLELVEARKLQRGTKGFLDPRAGDVHAIDLIEQQMDHVAKRDEAADQPSRNRGEAEKVICGRGAGEQEEDGGKLRMKDASVHREFGEYLVEHVTNKEMDQDPQARQLDYG